MDVPNEIIHFTQQRFELSCVTASTKQVTVRSDDLFDQTRRGPIFSQQASEDRLKAIADFDGPELSGAVHRDLTGFPVEVVGGHGAFTYPSSSSKKSLETSLSS